MKYYCVQVGNEFYHGFQGQKGWLDEINNCTILAETKNYNRLLNEAKEYYPDQDVKLKEVEFLLEDV